MDLSIIIPARNEKFLAKTVENILENIEGDTEIIAVCDGCWPDPPIKDHNRITLIYNSTVIGQRSTANQAARLSRAKYIMKVDAHCAFDKGFDVKMMRRMEPDFTMVPIMRNLHAFDWVCKNGHRRYQGPSGPCKDCGEPTEMEMKWIGKTNPQSDSYCFDSEPHFQYFREYRDRPEYKEQLKTGLTESMSLQGSCFMLTRDKYNELNICDDDSFGHWGSQGIEVAVKTWLSGGRVLVNHDTWYAHMFRTQGGDFGFPYKLSGRQVSRAKQYAKELFFKDKWPQQKKPLSWLVEKFWPVPGWTNDDLNKIKGVKQEVVTITKPKSEVGLVYYTDNRPDERILRATRNQILNCSNGFDIVSVSLKPVDFGRNIVYDAQRGYLTMFRQILAGLEASQADIIFLVEHDVLYHPSHFTFRPPRKDIFYYDENRWFVDADSGRALFYNAASTSMLCADRELLVEHYRKRVERVEKEGFTYRLGFEPGNHPYPRGVDFYKREAWMSVYPSIDLRHNKNLTITRWSKDQFRNKGNLYAWKEADEIPGWGIVKGRMREIIDALQKV